jgi:hypothetical protein
MKKQCDKCGRWGDNNHECPKVNPMKGKRRPDLAEYNIKFKKGVKLSEVVKKKMSNATKGTKNPFYGLRHTKITKEENSAKIKEYYETHHPPSWINGKSKNRKYVLEKWINLAKQVYSRDNYTCQLCRKRGGLIHAHHIISWVENEKLAFDINNLITLCPSCHIKVHRNKIKVVLK